MRFMLKRGDQIIFDNLKVHSMKKAHENVTHIDKGLDFGIAFEGLSDENAIQIGDTIEAYEEEPKKIEKREKRFRKKAGIH